MRFLGHCIFVGLRLLLQLNGRLRLFVWWHFLTPFPYFLFVSFHLFLPHHEMCLPVSNCSGAAIIPTNQPVSGISRLHFKLMQFHCFKNFNAHLSVSFMAFIALPAITFWHNCALELELMSFVRSLMGGCVAAVEIFAHSVAVGAKAFVFHFTKVTKSLSCTFIHTYIHIELQRIHCCVLSFRNVMGTESDWYMQRTKRVVGWGEHECSFIQNFVNCI